MKAETKLKLKELAFDSVGIYTKSQGKGGIIRPRSPYENGWNAALTAIIEMEESFEYWFEKIERPIYKDMVEKLISKDILHFCKTEDGTIDTFIMISDTFAYACADAETVEMHNLQLIYDLNEKYGYDGLTAWVSRQRGTEPLEAYHTKIYKEAKQYLQERYENETSVRCSIALLNYSTENNKS